MKKTSRKKDRNQKRMKIGKKAGSKEGNKGRQTARKLWPHSAGATDVKLPTLHCTKSDITSSLSACSFRTNSAALHPIIVKTRSPLL